MTGNSANVGPSRETLARWIEDSGENDCIDAKAPMAWDGAKESASLAKDFAAFANSRDGGVIVIGKAEASDGRFSYTGLTSEEASTFDTTKVAQWVNARFSPPIRLTCYREESQGHTFVVIVVQQFDDIPTICIRSYQDPTNPKSHLLREGEIYVRSQNAASKPLKTADELRAIIGLATRRRGDELLAHLAAMLNGRALTSLGPAPDPFEQEVAQVQNDLHYSEGKGGWWMAFHPQQYIADRWSTTEQLEQLVAASAVRVYREFPGHKREVFRMGWGIANALYGETWALTKSGLFWFWKQFRENTDKAERTGYLGGEEATRPIPPGKWLEFTWAIHTTVELFMFLSRFVVAYGPGDSVRVNLKVGPLEGRALVALSRDIGFIGYGAPESCRAPYFTFGKSIEAEMLRTSWEAAAADALQGLFELFPNDGITRDTILQWVERYKTRRI